jgi:hypothetical protein
VVGDEAEYERLRLDLQALALLRASYRGVGDPLEVLRRRFSRDSGVEARRRMLREQAFARGGDDGALAAFEGELAADDRALEAALNEIRAGEEELSVLRAGSEHREERPARPAVIESVGEEQHARRRRPASVRVLLASVGAGAFLLGATAMWAGGRIAQTPRVDPLGGEPLVTTLDEVRERPQESRDRLPPAVTARVVSSSTRVIVGESYPPETRDSPWQVYIGEDTLGYRLCFIAVYDGVENSTLCVPEESAGDVRFAAYADDGDTLAVDIDDGEIRAARAAGG